jgi:hypothetical protein
MLHEFIAANRQEIISRCRTKVARRSDPPPTPAEVEHGVPVFLDQLVELMRHGGASSADISATAVLHGSDLLSQGFTVSQVVHDYGDICQSITDLAVETEATISTEDFRTLNRCLDDAIAGAVTEFGRKRETTVLSNDADTSELVDLVSTAILAFNVLRTGNVGVGGSTGRVLDRSLTKLALVVTRLLGKVTPSETSRDTEIGEPSRAGFTPARRR